MRIVVIFEKLRKSTLLLLLVKSVVHAELSTMKIEVEIREGDKIEMNGKTYRVDTFISPAGAKQQVVLLSELGERKNFDREELEDLVRHSGSFRRTREEYIGVV